MASPQSCVRSALHPSGPAFAARPHRSRAVGRLGAAVFLGAAASLALTLLPGIAAAAPGSATQATTAKQATALVADSTHELEVVTA